MGEWKVFLKRIIRPLTRLVKSVRFFLYFFTVICVLGALGTWISAGQLWFGSESVSALNVYRNFATYTISIAVTALADCLVRDQDDNGTFRLFLLSMAVLSVIAAVIVLVTSNQERMFWLSVFGGFGFAWVWMNVHDSDRDLTESAPLSPLGGEMP